MSEVAWKNKHPMLAKLAGELRDYILRRRGYKKIEGRLTCPQCGKVFIPSVPYEGTKPDTIEREQWLTGICSLKCWKKFTEENAPIENHIYVAVTRARQKVIMLCDLEALPEELRGILSKYGNVLVF